eukprot:ctg_1778.g554
MADTEMAAAVVSDGGRARHEPLKTDTASGASATDLELKERKALTTVLQSWREVNLDALCQGLDAVALQVAERQDASAEARRRLAADTKQFRQLEPATRLERFPQLLKAYQQEVDRLTARARAAEGAFLKLYRPLYDAPDPVPLLELALRRREEDAVQEQSLVEMRGELERYRREAARAAEQETRVHQLERALAEAQRLSEEAQRRADQQAEQQVAERVWQARERELQARARRAEEAEQRWRTRAEGSERALDEARQQLAATVKAKENEFTLMQTEVQTQAETIAELRAALARRGDRRDGGATEERHELLHARKVLELELVERDAQIAQLRAQVQAAQEQLAASEPAAGMTVTALQQQLQERDAQIAALQEALQQLPSPEQMRALEEQLHALTTPDEEEEGEASAPERPEADGDANGGRGAPWQRALVRRNRTLEREVASVRAQLAQREAHCDQVERELAAVRTDLRDHQQWLEQLDRAAAVAGADGLSPSASPSTAAASTKSATTEGGSAPSMITVLCSQRDRLRHRVLELEKANRQRCNEVERCVAERDAIAQQLADTRRTLQQTQARVTENELAAALMTASRPGDTADANDMERGLKQWRDRYTD